MEIGKMNDGFLSTIEPFEIHKTKYYIKNKVKDVKSLKPSDPDNDILLIIGEGWNVIDDLSRFLDFFVSFDTMAINFVPKILPPQMPIHHFIAGDSHMEDMQLVASKLPDTTIKHCWNTNGMQKHVQVDQFDIRWARNSSKPWNGTTANLGVKIGIALGYMKIVLAGCPMDGGGNWYTKNLANEDVKKYKDHTAHLWKWVEIASRPIGRFIRSMSGNTADLLGEPNKEWLEDV